MNEFNNLTLKKRAKTFYFASLFFPKDIRTDIETLYLFCRYVDDIGDTLNLKKKATEEKLKKITYKFLKDLLYEDKYKSNIVKASKKSPR